MAGRELFVGNLPYSTTEGQLRELFERSGAKVESLRIVTDLDSGRSRGFAFVELSSPDEARRVLQALQDAQLEGRKLTLSEARHGGTPRRPGGRA